MKKKLLVTAAVSGLMMAGTVGISSTAHAGAKGECHGVNSCKGTGACGGEGHACKGKNSCKGKGWTNMSKKDCEAKILKKAKKDGMFHKKG